MWTPPHKISNDELVKSFNTYVELYNSEHSDKISEGSLKALEPSSSEFIVKASGIKNRYVVEKESLLDPTRMKPKIEARSDDQLSFSAEVSVIAAKEALKNANLEAKDVDAVIVSAANLQRAYPATAIEVQEELGIEIEVGSKLITIDHAYTHFKVTLNVFNCKHLSGEPKPIECDEVKWVTLDEIDEYPFPKATVSSYE